MSVSRTKMAGVAVAALSAAALLGGCSSAESVRLLDAVSFRSPDSTVAVRPPDSTIPVESFGDSGDAWRSALVSVGIRDDLLIIEMDGDLLPEERVAVCRAAEEIRDERDLSVTHYLIMSARSRGTLGYGPLE